MFERREPFNWKMPLLIMTGIVVLGTGIFVGVKTKNTNDKENIATEVVNEVNEKNNTNTKDVFVLSDTCEIWVEKISEDGEVSENSSVMVGMIPDELLNKTEEEIRNYLAQEYPDRKVESITYGQIVLSEEAPSNDPSKKNKYSLEVEDGLIGLYKYDINGNRDIKEQTKIKIDSLPQSVQEKIQQGILVDTEEEAYSRLEDFVS